MSSPNRQARASLALLNTTGSASASVIAARMQAFANPAAATSRWHQLEAQRMTSEKMNAAGEGMLAAGVEMALLPGRLLQLASRPSAYTPAGWLNACMESAGLWFGVGNAALRPAKSAAVRNRARLAGAGRHT